MQVDGRKGFSGRVGSYLDRDCLRLASMLMAGRSMEYKFVTCQGPSGPYELVLQLTARGVLPSTAAVLDKRRCAVDSRSRIMAGLNNIPTRGEGKKSLT